MVSLQRDAEAVHQGERLAALMQTSPVELTSAVHRWCIKLHLALVSSV